MVSLSYFSVNAPNAGKKKLLTSHLFFEEIQRHQETSHMMNHPKMKNEYIFALLHDQQTSQGFDMCTFFVQLPGLRFLKEIWIPILHLPAAKLGCNLKLSRNERGTIFHSPPFGTLFDGFLGKKSSKVWGLSLMVKKPVKVFQVVQPLHTKNLGAKPRHHQLRPLFVAKIQDVNSMPPVLLEREMILLMVQKSQTTTWDVKNRGKIVG